MSMLTLAKPFPNSEYRELHLDRQETITVVILGETGSGKSCLIDLLRFWARESCGERPKFEDAAKLSIIDKRNEVGGSQSGSQTIKPQNYSFHLQFQGRHYIFELLDTPGMGDIKGLTHDDENIKNILSFVEQTPSVNAIILMLNGSNCRVSARTQYILQRLYGMCPKTFENHLYLIFSNTQLEPNFDWKKEIKVPIRKENVIPIDNLLFSPGGLKYASSNPIQRKKIEQNYEENKEIVTMLFQQLMKGLERRLFQLSTENIVMLVVLGGALRPDAFKNLRINRDTLRVKVSGILIAIQESIGIQEEVNTEMRDLQNNIAPSLELLRKKANMTTERVEIIQCSTHYHNTHCLRCGIICHENCQLSYTTAVGDNIFRGCACMENDECKDCKHNYTEHVHVNFIFDRQIIKEPLLTDDERQELNATTSVEQQKQIIINKLGQRRWEKKHQVETFENDLKIALRELKSLCPHYDYKMELRCAIKLLEEAELINDKRFNRDELESLKTHFNDLIIEFDTAIQGSSTTVNRNS